MTEIMNLREKRVQTWNAAKAFLESHRGNDGMICFYMSNEGLSLLENAAYIGLPIPDKLKDILEQLHDRDKKEDKTTDTGDGE